MVPFGEEPGTGRRLSFHLRGHLLQFDKQPIAGLEASAGIRLLLIAAALEAARLAAIRWLGPSIPLWLLLPLVLALALLAVPAVAGLKWSRLGFHRWRSWTRTEQSYFLQVILIANVLFPVVFAAPLRHRFLEQGVALACSEVFFPYLVFGFYQEVVYRGMVQLTLASRWRAPLGVLAANVLYTFGPLHWSYFSSPPSLAIPMFGSIFLIGIFFGLLFSRSGNLWIVTVFHAIGNAYILTALLPLRSGAG